MCGRFVNMTQVQEIERRFEATFIEPLDYTPSPNIAAGEKAAVITCESPNKVQLFHYGFTPHWAHKPTYVLNARTEGDYNRENAMNYTGGAGILNKPMFRKAIRSQRCIVIADAFIEGPQDFKLSKPYVMYPSRNQGPVALAGIYDVWENPLTGEQYKSFAIITTAANSLTHRIGHHRAPLVLSREDEKVWLDQDADLQDITALMKPFNPQGWNLYPVSSRIKRAHDKSVAVLQPIDKPLIKQYDYVVYNKFKEYGIGTAPTKEKRQMESMQLFLF